MKDTAFPQGTVLIAVDALAPESATVRAAAAVLLAGGLVAFPTETVYGLGANALDGAAVRKIFAAKQRPAHDPLIVHVAAAAELFPLADPIPDAAWLLAERFWPGPLTLVLPRTQAVPDEVCAGGQTVAVRSPAHAVAQALLRAAGTPIAAPSANLFGHTSPTTAQHVWDDLHGRIGLILDAGPTQIGVESTVLDLSAECPVVLRPGGVPIEALREILGRVDLRSAAEPHAPLPSPGLLDRHYAPHTPLLLFEGARSATLAALIAAACDELEVGRLPVVLAYAEDELAVAGLSCPVFVLGAESDAANVARRLYAALREADAVGANLILARSGDDTGVGAAVRDRMRRAAHSVITLP